MDSVLSLARWQFGITTVYHFFFVPLTLGLSILLALMETAYVRTGKEIYRKMVKFWGKLFLINFAMGVATGIVQEFQFGMNWSEYSRYVGDVFGSLLAIEALLAFFLESTFLGIWVFGWDKLSKKLHAATIWAVAIGSNLSAFWILCAHSWMQHPVGFKLNPETGRAEMESFLSLITNPQAFTEFGHVVLGGVCAAAFFVLGISAWHLARRKPETAEFFRRSFRWAAVYGLLGALAVAGVGHLQAQELRTRQPMKLAASEALWETENPAAFSLVAAIDQKAQTTRALRIPAALSILCYNKPSGEVRGIKDLQAEYERNYGPGNYIPNVAVTFWTFRIMVGAGLLMILLALVAVWNTRKDRMPEFKPWGWALLAASLALPYIANSTGWMMTELGRQPWVVLGLMKTEAGVSLATSPAEVWTSLIGFAVIYGALMVADVYLLRKFSLKNPMDETAEAH